MCGMRGALCGISVAFIDSKGRNENVHLDQLCAMPEVREFKENMQYFYITGIRFRDRRCKQYLRCPTRPS